MKKYIIGIVIIILVIIAGLVGYKIVLENEKKYEIAKVNEYNYFVLKQDDKNGVLDKSGNIIIAAEYDDVKIPNPEKEIFICSKGESVKVLNSKNEEIFTEYQDIAPIRLKNIASDLMYEKSVLTYSENEKYGLVNFSGKKLTNAIYEEIEGLPYKEGELLVKENGKYGVLNLKGKQIVKTEYEQITVDGYYTEENNYEYSGYIVSTKTEDGYRYGYINYNGKIILKTEYNELSRIAEIEDNENVYMIGAKNGQFGITKNNKTIIGNEYQSIRYDSENNLLVVEKSKKYGIANLDGKVIVPVEYSQIDIVGIYIYAKNEQGTIVYNNNGTEANIETNVAILNTSNEKYRIRINNQDGTKYGIIGKEGKKLVEEKYNYLEYLYDNYFIASSEHSKLGIIDDKGNEKVEILYDALQKIQGTDLIQASISESKITRIFNKNMEKIYEAKDVNIEKLENNIKVYNDNEIKYFNLEGIEVKNTEVYSNNELFAKEKNGKWGFINKSEKNIVDYKYDKVTEFNKYGYAGVKKDGKWGAINKEGKEVIEPTYELLKDNEPSFIGKYYQVKYGFGEVYFTDKNK